jgi:hypothetical protein
MFLRMLSEPAPECTWTGGLVSVQNQGINAVEGKCQRYPEQRGKEYAAGNGKDRSEEINY